MEKKIAKKPRKVARYSPKELKRATEDWTATVAASKSLQPSSGHCDYEIFKTFQSWDAARDFYMQLYKDINKSGWKYISLSLTPAGPLGDHDTIYPDGKIKHERPGEVTLAHWTNVNHPMS